jgi:glycosyltransferase involved in cell wall biosynthesis
MQAVSKLEKLKIAILVHGRFHAFDLAKALLKRGHDVYLFTNYPKWAVKRFGFPTKRVHSFWVHGILTRIVRKLDPNKNVINRDRYWHPLFGRWAAQQMSKEKWDVVHLWSGVSEESLLKLKKQSKLRLMMRGSAHISTQSELLKQETQRTGVAQDHPSEWMIAREKSEYDLADVIITLSSFARQTFIDKGFSTEKVKMLPLGAILTAFRPPAEVIEKRCERILSGDALRVLYVGAVSYQKGFKDLVEIVRGLNNGEHQAHFTFRVIGPVTPEVKSLVADMEGKIEFIPKRPQAELPEHYNWADVFVFPTIQDGYAVVLTQASASSLPILATTNCGGPDFIREGQTGWILPIRDPQAFIDRLNWCDSHRAELVEMVRQSYQKFKVRDWDNVAADFEDICLEKLTDCRRPADL